MDMNLSLYETRVLGSLMEMDLADRVEALSLELQELKAQLGA